MSLEATIQENTAAIRELIAKLTAGAAITTAQAVQVIEKPVTAVAEVLKEEVKKPAAAEVSAAAVNDAAALTTQTEPGAADAGDKAPEVTYDQVKDCIKEMAKKSRDMAVGALKEFGAAKGPDLKPEQFAAFVAHANKLLGAA